MFFFTGATLLRLSAFPFRSHPTRTSSSSLFHFLDAQPVVASVQCTLALYASFFSYLQFCTKKRNVEFCLYICPTLSLSPFFILLLLAHSFSFSLCTLSHSLFVALIVISPRSRRSSTEWFKPLDITT